MSKSVSCLIVDDEAVAREIIVSHLAKIENINIVHQCKNAIEAFNFINNHSIDLIFLDINMPEISGIAFAKSINKDIKIIFTTAYRDYAVEGFDLQAVDYLLKPIAFERLLKSVNRYFEVAPSPVDSSNIKGDKGSNFIFVRSDRKMLKVDFEAIYYIESFSDYLKIHTDVGQNITRETISAIEAKLPKDQFLRIHRSYIISIQKIESYTNEHIAIAGKELPMSRSYKKEVLSFMDRLN